MFTPLSGMLVCYINEFGFSSLCNVFNAAGYMWLGKSYRKPQELPRFSFLRANFEYQRTKSKDPLGTSNEFRINKGAHGVCVILVSYLFGLSKLNIVYVRIQCKPFEWVFGLFHNGCSKMQRSLELLLL